jgi:hypothetical protein
MKQRPNAQVKGRSTPNTEREKTKKLFKKMGYTALQEAGVKKKVEPSTHLGVHSSGLHDTKRAPYSLNSAHYFFDLYGNFKLISLAILQIFA